MNKIISPITGSDNIKNLDSHSSCISSEGIIMTANVDNYICLDSGLIFNGTGARGGEDEYYSEEYDLHSENDESEFKYKTDDGFVGIYENIYKFISNNSNIKNFKNYLDIGCGKGLLLKKFQENHNELNLYGIEPSKQAKKMYTRIVPNAEIFSGNLEDASLSRTSFDLISTNGVLEHVPEPTSFLNKLYSMLNDEGYCYVGVPNFVTNPADIYTFDHLTRFTPSSIKMLFSISGFEVKAELIDQNRVPMWYLIQKNRNISRITLDSKKELDIFYKNASDMKNTLASIQKCFDNLKGKKEKIAIYGTGATFPLSTLFTDISFDDVFCYIDDNDHLLGTLKNNIPVHLPEILLTESIKNIIISANPCYHSQIINKIKSFNINEVDIYY